MDDLLGEDWQQPSRVPASTTPAYTQTPNLSSLRASPAVSGTASPIDLSRPSSTVNGNTKRDTFGNLLALKSQKDGGGNVSMQERQRRLLEEKQRQQQATANLWESLGSGRSTPAARQPSPAIPNESDDDILAAFHKDAPVDTASHFAPPPASRGVSGRNTPAASETKVPQGVEYDADDDPFELGQLSKKENGHATAPVRASTANAEDDILGDLAKPISARPTPTTIQHEDSANVPTLDDDSNIPDAAPEDRALAELVEMGFPADTARIALNETNGNVQSAVGWLLQQAHEESRQKAKVDTSRTQSPHVDSRSPPRRVIDEQAGMPAWMHNNQNDSRSSSATRQRGTVNGEKDASQVAQDIGNKVWKSANTLWKSSQKQMAKTIADIQQGQNGVESSQPKWMRQPDVEPDRLRTAANPQAAIRDVVVTNEAAALDAPRERGQKQPASSSWRPQDPSRSRSPIEPQLQRPSPPSNPTRPVPIQAERRQVNKISRQDVEQQSAQAYVSPARRKRPTAEPKSETVPRTEPTIDLFDPSPASQPATRPQPTTSAAKPALSNKTPTTNVSAVQRAPPRTIPPVSSSALQTSASHRKAGGEHFKRGDYAAAHDSYTLALDLLPANHPIAIVVLSNRSLTSLKTGNAKIAVSDADRALEVIGIGQGVGETIDLGPGEGTKDMKDFYGKALMRKAEAFEHMERYSDAASIWRQAVEAGIGGAISLRGKDRCEKAAAPKSTAPKPARPPKTRPAKPLGDSRQRPTLSTPVSADAVNKLRAANAKATKEEDEKFALSDSVDAKLTAWKGGKSDNLRALLQSMDLVLWPEAGWKKVGMSDLVMPARVKIIYMKAIGKVHPDKIPQNASTEERMISAAVFSTLNEAWDGFKAQNNM